MVRKAKTLGSMDELNVSAKTLAYLEKSFYSVGSVIKYGRSVAYESDVTFSKWKVELVSALKEAGFIRPKTDFTNSFRVEALYRAVYLGDREDFAAYIGQLSTEEYEDFVDITDEEVEGVKLSLCDQLSNKEYQVICWRFGLDGDGDQGRDFISIGHYFGVTGQRIQQIEAKALEKLKLKNALPVLLNVPREVSETIVDLESRLNKLHKDPIFGLESYMLAELEYMRKLPFRYPDEANEQLGSSDLAELNLNLATYNCLRRARIDTISDILHYPKDLWPKVKNLGRKRIKEVEEQMRLAGYKDFSVDA